MGVDIIAISKAKRVACNSRTCEADDHYCVGSYHKRTDGLKRGCYVVGKGGQSFWMPAGTYAGYDQWRTELCQLAIGTEPDEVWEHPRRYRGRSFVELIDFPDAMGPVIGPKTSAKLYHDFESFAGRARKHFLTPPPQTKTKRRKAFKRHINRLGAANAREIAKQLGGKVVGPDDDREWMWEIYRNFRRAFRIAHDRGLVQFC